MNESIKAIKEALNRHREMFDMTSLLDSRDSLATTIEDEIVRLARRLTPRTCAALMDEVYLVDRRPWSRLTDEEKVCLVTGTLELHTCPAWAFTVHLAHEKGRLINEGKTPFDDHHAAFRDSLRRALPADIRDEAIIVSAMEVSDAAARRDPTRPIGLHFHGLVALPARAKADQEDLKPQIRRALWIASGHQKHARHPPMMQLEPWDHPRPMGWALYTTKGTKRPDSKLVGKDLVKFSHSAVRRGRAFHETVVQSWARALRRASFELERYTRTQEALGVIELSQLDRAA